MNSFQTSFENWYNLYHQELNDDLMKLERIADIKEKYEKAKNFFLKHEQIEGNLRANYNNGSLYGIGNYSSKYHDYEGKTHKLRKIRDECEKKLSEETTNNFREKNNISCSFCNTKSKLYHSIYNRITNSLQWTAVWNSINSNELVFCNQGCFDEWWKIKHSKNEPIRPRKPTNINNLRDYGQEDNYETTNNITNEICAKCNKSLQVGNEYYYKKNDNKKFCSTYCYDKYYKKNKTELEKKEEVFSAYETIWKEVFEKNPLVLPEEISLPSAEVFYKLLEQKQEKGQLETYTQQKLEEIRQIRSNKSNNIREREREREQNLLQYFTTHSIQSIRLDNNKLLIKYNHKEEEEEEEPNTPELEKIKDYLEGIPTKSITKTELESKSKQDSSDSFSNENKDSNLGLFLGLGVVGLVCFFTLIIFARISKRNKK